MLELCAYWPAYLASVPKILVKHPGANVRILAIDVGTGTQDILLFDSSAALENNPKLVMPSPTSIIAQRVRDATRHREAILLTGATMGGGPCAWAVEDHLKAGYVVYATPEAALTFDDHLVNVERMGIQMVSEDEAHALKDVLCIEMKDLDMEAVGNALTAFGIEPRYDGVAVAVFDHGAAPLDVSDRAFRFDHLSRMVQEDDRLESFAYLAHEVPAYLTRMRAVIHSYSSTLEAPLLLSDTAPAGALGAVGDPVVREHSHRLLVNLGNMHATAFHLKEDRIMGIFEHHTGLVDQEKLNHLLQELVAGTLTNDEVFNGHGHGAHIFRSATGHPFLAVTGPQRGLMRGSPLDPHFAVPYGDMMLSGCFGLLRAFAAKSPQWREEILHALEG